MACIQFEFKSRPASSDTSRKAICAKDRDLETFPLLEDEGGTCHIIRGDFPGDLDCTTKPAHMSFTVDCCDTVSDVLDFAAAFKIVDSEDADGCGSGYTRIDGEDRVGAAFAACNAASYAYQCTVQNGPVAGTPLQLFPDKEEKRDDLKGCHVDNQGAFRFNVNGKESRKDFSLVCKKLPTTSPTSTVTTTPTTTATTYTMTTTTTATTSTTATGTTTTKFDARNIDCIEDQYPCTRKCERADERDYIQTSAAKHNGRACIGPVDCEPGDGACPTTTTTPTTAHAKATGASVPVRTIASNDVGADAVSVANDSSGVDRDRDTGGADASNQLFKEDVSSTDGPNSSNIADTVGGEDESMGNKQSSAAVPVIISLSLVIMLVIVLVAWRLLAPAKETLNNGNNLLDLGSYSYSSPNAAVTSFANAKQKRARGNRAVPGAGTAPLNRPPMTVPRDLSGKHTYNDDGSRGGTPSAQPRRVMSHDVSGYLEPSLVTTVANPAYANPPGAEVDVDDILGMSAAETAFYEEPVAENPTYLSSTVSGLSRIEADYADLVGHNNDSTYDSGEGVPDGFGGSAMYVDADANANSFERSQSDGGIAAVYEYGFQDSADQDQESSVQLHVQSAAASVGGQQRQKIVQIYGSDRDTSDEEDEFET